MKYGLLLSCLLLCAACGGPQRELGEVSGRVTFQGGPVPEAVLIFQGVDTHVAMTTQTDAEGRYRVVMAEGPGLPLGKYQIAVVPWVADVETGAPVPPPPVRPDIPQRVRQAESSGMQVEVKSGKNEFQFDLAQGE